jgi:DNA polymerase-1
MNRAETPADEGAVYLLDGTYLVFRAFFAIRSLNAPDGTPTGGVFGFVSTVRKLLRERAPAHFAVAFDREEPTHRDDLFEEYKKNRPEPPPELVPQFQLAWDASEALGWPVVTAPGFEADDVIATLARQALERGREAVIVTADKDLYQLVRPGVRVLNPMKEDRLLDAEGIAELFGARPEQVRDVLALMGDASDNVPGVPGVGEKTAKGMVARYGDLETILERAQRFAELWNAKERLLEVLENGEDPEPDSLADVARTARALLEVEQRGSVPTPDEELQRKLQAAAGVAQLAAGGKLKEVKRALKDLAKKTQPKVWLAAAEHAEQARFARELVTVRDDAPVELDLGQIEPERPALERAHELFERLGFRGLSEELAEAAERAGGESTRTPAVADELDVTVVRDPAGLERFLAPLAPGTPLAVDTETDSLEARRANLVGISLCHGPDSGIYIPVRHAGGPPADWEVMRARLADLLGDPRRGKIGQNLKFDAAVLRRAGMPLRGIAFDTLVAAQLLEPGRDVSHRLDDLVRRYLGARTVRYADVVGHGEGELTFDQVDEDSAARYAVEDAVVAWRLAEVLRRELEQAGLWGLFERIEAPLVEVLERMEALGVAIDLDRLAEINRSLQTEQERLEREIHELAGRPFNINSPPQLREVLFDELGLKPTGRRTQKTRVHSTGQEALEALRHQHPLPAKVLSYREIAKLRGTYVEALPKLVDSEDGRLHTQLHQLGAATGRLSSSDPNLQNIPIRSELGRSIRQGFVPAPGYLLLSADYSQMELRILAHLSGDETLVEAFRRGLDIHRFTAALVAGIEPGEVDAVLRAQAKAVNFGIIYGMSEFRLAREQGMTREEARAFIDAYFARYPQVKAYIDGVEHEVQTSGEVRTLFGRRRSFPELLEPEGSRARPNAPAREQLLRQAVNTTVQGTAADIVKRAMVRLDGALEQGETGARLLLQVHDELVLEVPEAEVEPVSELVRDVMQDVAELTVPLEVELASARNWAEAH